MSNDNQKGNGTSNGNGNAGHSNILTTRQGHPVTDNQNLRTVTNRGPATLENYQFLEKMSHFDRERVPERVVHARGAGRMAILKLMEQLEMKQYQNIPGLNCSRKKGKRHLYLCDFLQ